VKLKVKQNYAELRRKEYPAIGDQLDALWKGGEALEAMRQQIVAVKEKYKKPKEVPSE
jgi:hypothetical protein